MIFKWLLTLIILIVGSIYDYKYYRLPIWLLGLGLLSGVSCWLIEGKEWMVLMSEALPGVVALGLSFFTREQIGYGDGIMLLILGFCLGLQYSVLIVLVGLAGCFLTSVFLIAFHKAKGKTRIPFVPYMCFGAIVVMIGSLI